MQTVHLICQAATQRQRVLEDFVHKYVADATSFLWKRF